MTGPGKVETSALLARLDGTGELRASDPSRVGSYRVLRRLGSGGMGQVYLARSPGGRAVAIKVIRPDLAEKRGFRARFAREVAAARGVNGMFTAAVVDADPDAELPWMATAYVDGPSLADAVEEHGPLPSQAVLSLAAGLAEGLQAIHQAGLVHRDLKPSNVLLAGDGPRVIDFGISWAGDGSRLTDAGMTVGSPGFLSPEQARGHEVTEASDVFSLGAVLTYAATGEGPFGEGADEALMYRVVHERPDLARVPDELRWLIESCLAKKPGYRPTVGQLLDRLAQVTAAGQQSDSAGLHDSAAWLHAAGGPETGASGAGLREAGDRAVEAGGSRAGMRKSGARGIAMPMTGDRLSGTYVAVPDTPGGAYTSVDGPMPDLSGFDDREPRARRLWLPLAGAAACVAVAAGSVMFLMSSSNGPGTGPANPPAFVAPAVPGAPTGTGAAARQSSSAPGHATLPPGSATSPSASGSPSSSAPAARSGTTPAGTASQAPPSSASQPPSSGPTTPAQPTTAPAPPPSSPSRHCILGIIC
jgi:eukaryotic-like serine/threonine-protein kinase